MKVTTVLAIRVGNMGEGGSPPGEQIPRKRGSPKTQKVGFKSNTDVREILLRRGSQKSRKFAHKIKDFSETNRSLETGAIFLPRPSHYLSGNVGGVSVYAF